MKRILLVDDEPLVLQTLGADLEQHGYEVASFDNGPEAVSALQQQHFDLVIADLVMEGMDGLTVLRRAKEQYAFTRSMILTGYGDLESAIAALRLGVDDYVEKPCDRDEMRARVDQCLDRPIPAQKAAAHGRLLPVCCVCKKVRVRNADHPDGARWAPFEEYMVDCARQRATSTYCPECADKAMGPWGD
jgi:DNA-binding response OmpR family regulator